MFPIYSHAMNESLIVMAWSSSAHVTGMVTIQNEYESIVELNDLKFLLVEVNTKSMVPINWRTSIYNGSVHVRSYVPYGAKKAFKGSGIRGLYVAYKLCESKAKAIVWPYIHMHQHPHDFWQWPLVLTFKIS